MKFNLTFFAICLLAFVSSCEKNDTERTWVSIEETQCANPWDDLGLGSTEDNVTGYLKNNGIRIYGFNIEVYSDGPFCMACTCASGRIIQVLVGNSEIGNIKELGFQE